MVSVFTLINIINNHMELTATCENVVCCHENTANWSCLMWLGTHTHTHTVHLSMSRLRRTWSVLKLLVKDELSMDGDSEMATSSQNWIQTKVHQSALSLRIHFAVSSQSANWRSRATTSSKPNKGDHPRTSLQKVWITDDFLDSSRRCNSSKSADVALLVPTKLEAMLPPEGQCIQQWDSNRFSPFTSYNGTEWGLQHCKPITEWGECRATGVFFSRKEPKHPRNKTLSGLQMVIRRCLYCQSQVQCDYCQVSFLFYTERFISFLSQYMKESTWCNHR